MHHRPLQHGGDDDGVEVHNGAQINSCGTGSATITITGSGGTGSTDYGIELADTGTAVTSVAGDITLIGTSPGGDGVYLGNGVQISSVGLGADAARITIQGTGGGTSSDEGVHITGANTTVSSVAGKIQITGGSGGDDDGVEIENGAQVVSAGTGVYAADILIHGTNGIGTTDYSVEIADVDTRVAAIDGLIEIHGNKDVSVGSDAVVSSESSSADVVITTNDIIIRGTINAGSGRVIILPASQDLTYDLGSTSGTGQCVLTDDELDQIFTSNRIVIGDATSGDISFTGPVDPAGADVLKIISGTLIRDTNTRDPDYTGTELILSGNVSPGRSPGIFSVNSDLVLAPDDTFSVEVGGTTPGTTDHRLDQLDVTGAVLIGSNVTLDVKSYNGFAPVSGDTFVIVNNDGVEPVSGTFAGLPEASLITNFLDSGLDAVITYEGGDGNDVALIVVHGIGGLIWHDLYHGSGHLTDGIQDAGEGGLAGVVVNLLDGAGALVTSDTTDATGSYKFADLSAGTYIVEVSPENLLPGAVLEGWYATFKDNGTDETKDSDGNRTTYRSDPVVLSVGQARTDLDFGLFTSAIDLIKTGPDAVEAGEVITYHFRVQNLGDVVQHGGAQVYDPMINPDGDHKIWNGVLQPGQVVEFDRVYTTTADYAGELVNTAWAVGRPLCPDGKYAKNVTDTDDWTVTVTPPKDSIGGLLWHDLYHGPGHLVDGIQDAGEPGLAGVAVSLLDGTGALTASTTTDAAGFYQFTGLDAGTYVVEVSGDNFLPGGVLRGRYATLKDRGGDESKDSDGDLKTHRSNPVILTTDEQSAGVDFGFFTSIIDLTKTGPQTAQVGETIAYHFRVQNLGDVIQAGGAQVYDPMIKPDGDHKIWHGRLQPGQVVEFDRMYTITADDAGKLVNSAWAVGHPLRPDGKYVKNVTDTDKWTVTVSPTDPGTDCDGDGIVSGEEFGPDGNDHSFDGNADSVPDWAQDNVASWHTITGDYVTIVCGETYALSSVDSVDDPSPDDVPPSVDAPYGFFEFEVLDVPAGGSVFVELLVPDGSIVDSYYKYGGTPADPTPHWYEFDFDGTTGAVIDKNVIRLHFVDGQRGDDDLIANGVIIDPGMPARIDQPAPTSTVAGYVGPADADISQASYSADDAGTAETISANPSAYPVTYPSVNNDGRNGRSIDNTISSPSSSETYHARAYMANSARSGSNESAVDFHMPIVAGRVLSESTSHNSRTSLIRGVIPEPGSAVFGSSDHTETSNPVSAARIVNGISSDGLGSDGPTATTASQLAGDGQGAIAAEAAGLIAATDSKLNGSIQDRGWHFRRCTTAALTLGLTVLFALSHYVGQKRRKEGRQQQVPRS